MTLFRMSQCPKSVLGALVRGERTPEFDEVDPGHWPGYPGGGVGPFQAFKLSAMPMSLALRVSPPQADEGLR